MLQACSHMAEMPFKQQGYCSRNRACTERKHKHVPVLLTTGNNKPLFDAARIHLGSYISLCVLSLCQDFRHLLCFLSCVVLCQAEDSELCGDDHSPGLLGGRLHQEEYDRCEHDVGTFGKPKRITFSKHIANY